MGASTVCVRTRDLEQLLPPVYRLCAFTGDDLHYSGC